MRRPKPTSSPAQSDVFELIRRIPLLCDEDVRVDPSTVATALLLMNSAQQILAHFERYFASWELSQGRFIVLMLLAVFKEETWTPALLAERAQVTRATISGLLKRLRQDDLIETLTDPEDRRRVLVRLSAAGERKLAAMLPVHLRRMEEAFGVLDAQDRRALPGLLSKVMRVGVALNAGRGEETGAGESG